VEDDPALLRTMAERLEQMGFLVRWARHYEAAVSRLGEAGDAPSLVCVDLELPTRSGYDLCEVIRGDLGLARVPILVTSDSGSPKGRAHAEEAGAGAFLRKPFSMRTFAACVEALIEPAHADEIAAPQQEL
jgi:DNA-binding response OmpR family regulator